MTSLQLHPVALLRVLDCLLPSQLQEVTNLSQIVVCYGTGGLHGYTKADMCRHSLKGREDVVTLCVVSHVYVLSDMRVCDLINVKNVLCDLCARCRVC